MADPASQYDSKIVLYDIPSTQQPMAWSPNTWRVRFILNLKNIPYRTEWISYPDIRPTLTKFNETSDSPGLIDPSDPETYTLPVIRIPASAPTNQSGVANSETTPSNYKYRYIKDSFIIAQYLDKTYPSTPPLFPAYTRALQSGFQVLFLRHLGENLRHLLIAQQVDKLESQPAKDFYIRTREEWLGHPLGEFCPPGSEKEKTAWEGIGKGVKEIGRLLTRYGWNEGELEADKGWVMGAVGPTWIDINIASMFVWFERMGPDDGWKRVTEMDGSEWVRRLWDNMSAHMDVV